MLAVLSIIIIFNIVNKNICMNVYADKGIEFYVTFCGRSCRVLIIHARLAQTEE